MQQILEELGYENICPNTQCNTLSAEAKQLMSYVTKHHDSLWETLSEKQQEMFENFNNCYSELTDLNQREIFVYAFRLGARIAIEVMNFDEE